MYFIISYHLISGHFNGSISWTLAASSQPPWRQSPLLRNCFLRLSLAKLRCLDILWYPATQRRHLPILCSKNITNLRVIWRLSQGQTLSSTTCIHLVCPKASPASPGELLRSTLRPVRSAWMMLQLWMKAIPGGWPRRHRVLAQATRGNWNHPDLKRIKWDQWHSKGINDIENNNWNILEFSEDGTLSNCKLLKSKIQRWFL